MSWFSGTSFGLFSAVAQSGFGWPPPFSGCAMRRPSDATMSTCRPLIGILSPAFRIVRLLPQTLR